MNNNDKPLDADVQTQLLALLCYSDEHGARIAVDVGVDCYDSIHRVIAEAALLYRSRYGGKAPGEAHMPTLIERLAVREERLKAARETHARMVQKLKRMNRDFITGLGVTFAARQRLIAGIYEAAKQAEAGQSYDDIQRTIYDSVMKNQIEDVEAAVSFADFERSTRFLNTQISGWKLGIKPLDDHGLRLDREQLLLYMGAKNTGKSWFAIQAAYELMRQEAKVFHISLEMSIDQVLMRYYQRWLAIAQNEARYLVARLDSNKKGQATAWKMDLERAKHTLKDKNIKLILQKGHDYWAQRRWDQLMVQQFPAGTLTPTKLANQLDLLEREQDFAPDVVIVDYPDLMALSTREYRLELGAVIKDLRGLAATRKLAMIAPTQVNRKGMDSEHIRGSHVAEDVSKLHTADTVLAYTATDTEKDYNLARLKLLYARSCQAGLEVVMSQAYAIGQYVIDAKAMSDEYMNNLTGKKDEGGNENKGKMV